MSKRVTKKPVSDEEIDAILNSDDPFTVAIRGHQALEELLNLVISERLADPHALEVKRLGFALKVDIASALGVIDDRGVFVGVNRIRNRFAHNRLARLTKRDIDGAMSGATAETREMLRSMAENHESGPVMSFKQIIAALFVRLQSQITAIRDEKAQWRIINEVMDEMLGPNRKPRKERAHERPSERATRLLEKERKQRHARGEL